VSLNNRSSSRRKEPAAELKLVQRRRSRSVAQDSGHPVHLSRPTVRTVAVASGKGGVGKSSLVANLAVVLGQQGVRVLLLDADLSQANLDLLLGVAPRFDLQHVLRGEKTLRDIVIEGPAGVKLVPASSGVPDLADLDDFRRESLLRGLSTLEDEVDLILMDTASGVSRQVIRFCLAADEVVVVTTQELPAFTDAYGFIKVLALNGLQTDPHLVVNMSDSAEEAEETAHRIGVVARRFLGLNLDPWGCVPYDPAVARAVRRQEPVVLAYPQSPAARAYRELARHLWDEPPAGNRSGLKPGEREKLQA
jgi:flagellar biosynthesis protein FlhG